MDKKLLSPGYTEGYQRYSGRILHNSEYSRGYQVGKRHLLFR